MSITDAPGRTLRGHCERARVGGTQAVDNVARERSSMSGDVAGNTPGRSLTAGSCPLRPVGPPGAPRAHHQGPHRRGTQTGGTPSGGTPSGGTSKGAEAGGTVRSPGDRSAGDTAGQIQRPDSCDPQQLLSSPRCGVRVQRWRTGHVARAESGTTCVRLVKVVLMGEGQGQRVPTEQL